MYAMPTGGGAGGLPSVFSTDGATGALILDDAEVVVLDD
jgi:hypothetical protein